MKTGMLASPLQIGKKATLNRFVVQPIEINSADDTGKPTELSFNRYRALAEGGAGMIFSEASAIAADGRARPNQLLVIEENAKELEELVKVVKEANPDTLFLFQIDHAGRLGVPGLSKLVSTYPTGNPDIHLLTEREIQVLKAQFVKSAVVAHQVGADGIDIKHGHGFLCAEFLRPANTRNDRYGGSFENRARFFREMTQEIKAAINDDSFLLGVRIAAYEGIPGGSGTTGPEGVIENLAETIQFARLVEAEGMDFINISAGDAMGNLEILLPTNTYPEGVYRHFGWTKAVKDAVRIPVIGSAYSYLKNGENNLIGDDPAKKSLRYWAEKNLQDGNVDLVGIGRQSLADPFFPKKLLSGQTESINFCKTCNNCGFLLGSQKTVGCTVYNNYFKNLLKQVHAA
ncbi:MAG: NADH:flavin oxidoreductase [bacterium]|nr:NADH:flavin oxidoreductase [bacterium]